MIFVTVGSHQDFDRLIRGVDAWAAARGGWPGSPAKLATAGYSSPNAVSVVTVLVM